MQAASASPLVQKLLAVVVSIAALAGIALLVLVWRNSPPRAWAPSSTGQDFSVEILTEFEDMLTRAALDFGDDIAAWLQLRAQARDAAFDDVVAEWRRRGDLSVLTRTFVLANLYDSAGALATMNRNPDNACSYATCDPAEFLPANTCERAVCGADGAGVDCKDFEENIWTEGGCPRFGGPPCYLPVGKRDRDGDLFFGTPRPLDVDAVVDGFRLWCNTADWDPVRRVMKADIHKIRLIENFELFAAALPVFLKERQSDYLLFRYVSPQEAKLVADYVAAADKAALAKPAFLRKLALVRGDAAEIAALKARVACAAAALDGVSDALIELIEGDAALLMQFVRHARDASAMDLTKIEREEFVDVLRAEPPPGSDLHVAHACVVMTDFAREKAGAVAGAGNLPQMRALLQEAAQFVEGAAKLFAQLQAVVEGRFGLGFVAASQTAQAFGAPWSELLALLAYDAPEEVERAYEAILAYDLGGDGCQFADVAAAMQTDFKSYLNALFTAVYSADYIAEAKASKNVLHVNAELAKRFYQVIKEDLKCAYIYKATFEPHKSELGKVYDTQSVAEMHKAFWKVDDMRDSVLQWFDESINRIRDACF